MGKEGKGVRGRKGGEREEGREGGEGLEERGNLFLDVEGIDAPDERERIYLPV